MKIWVAAMNESWQLTVDVEDPETGDLFQTLSMSRTPTMLLSFAANKFTEAAANYFQKVFGLGTVDWRILFLIARKPGTTSAQASQIIGVDKGTVSRSVSRLTSIELIKLGDVHANGRSRGLFLTPAGRKMHDKIFAVAMHQHTHLLNGFETAEIAMFCDLLVRFTRNLEESMERDRAELWRPEEKDLQP